MSIQACASASVVNPRTDRNPPGHRILDPITAQAVKHDHVFRHERRWHSGSAVHRREFSPAAEGNPRQQPSSRALSWSPPINVAARRSMSAASASILRRTSRSVRPSANIRQRWAFCRSSAASSSIRLPHPTAITICNSRSTGTTKKRRYGRLNTEKSRPDGEIGAAGLFVQSPSQRKPTKRQLLISTKVTGYIIALIRRQFIPIWCLFPFFPLFSTIGQQPTNVRNEPWNVDRMRMEFTDILGVFSNIRPPGDNDLDQRTLHPRH